MTRMKGATRALGPDDLVLSHFSLARDHPIVSRVELAASAGFAGIGLYVGQYRQLERDGFAPHGLRDLLDSGVFRIRSQKLPVRNSWPG